MKIKDKLSSWNLLCRTWPGIWKIRHKYMLAMRGPRYNWASACERENEHRPNIGHVTDVTDHLILHTTTLVTTIISKNMSSMWNQNIVYYYGAWLTFVLWLMLWHDILTFIQCVLHSIFSITNNQIIQKINFERHNCVKLPVLLKNFNKQEFVSMFELWRAQMGSEIFLLLGVYWKSNWCRISFWDLT